MLRLLIALSVLFLPPNAGAQIVPFSGAASGAAPSCSTGVLDTFAASPGAWTVAYSLRKVRAAYAGKAVQLTRSSDSTTLDIGFVGCDPDVTASSSLCGTATLSVVTASTRVAFPSGSVIHVFNAGPSPVFYAAGNSSVTATTASSELMFREGVNITVGANTNLAALTGSGFGIDGNAGAATLFLTNCGASKLYDQAGANDASQATLADQLGYYPTCQGSSLPCLFGCLSACNLKAADSASYKTATVETFMVMSFGEDITTANFNYASVVYPTTTSSAASDSRWGLSNNAAPDVLANNINGSNNGNAEGFGGVWRGQNLTQFDYSTGGILRWNGGTQFMSTGSGTPTYPNAVGLYVMGDAAGNGTPGTFVEALVASGTQTSRNSISANQVSYWGITTGAAASVALTNPLGDGWNWNQIQLGGFAPNPPGVGAITVNGNAYNSEASWNSYTQWQATNGSTAAGRLGDNWRFQINGLADAWDGTNRSEVDGAGGSAQFSIGTTFWIAYAVYIEPGTAYTSSWNINGQMHTVAGGICCIFNTMSNSNSVSDTWFVYTNNATTATQSSATTGVAITRGRWYHFVYQVGTSTSGTNDTFNVWLDTVTEGTMVQIASHSGASLFGGNGTNNAAYWKYGIYRETGNNLPTFGVRYGNMQVCSQGSDCTAKYGVSDLSALETTPLADPAHN
jgi:hypothetical protein